MATRVTENTELIQKRNDLWIEIEKHETTNDRKRTLAAEIMAYDDVITRNLEKRLAPLRIQTKGLIEKETPMSFEKRYNLLIRVGREANYLVEEVREYKKLLRDNKNIR